MFDRYLVQPTSQSVYKAVTEKRAPTDDSVRLLREMEAAAKGEVAKTIRLDFNGFKVVAQFMREDWNWQDRAVIHYDFNGRSVKVDVILERHQTTEEKVKKIVDDLTLSLSKEFFHDAARQFTSHLGGFLR